MATLDDFLNADNVNNGLITKIWGPPLWTALHCITFGYPVNPTEEHKINYKNYFINIKHILPCKYCRDSFNTFITTNPTILNDKVMESRLTLTKWLYDVHNRVNHKLGVDYGVSFNDIVKRYESYRAQCKKKITGGNVKGCLKPLYKKSDSYKISNIKDCPVINKNTVNKFKKYAKLRNVDNYYINMCDKLKLNNKNELWDKRNKLCDKIIQNMREKQLPSIEQNGKWKNLPTKEELKLIMMHSSNLNKEELDNINIDINTSYNWLGVSY